MELGEESKYTNEIINELNYFVSEIPALSGQLNYYGEKKQKILNELESLLQYDKNYCDGKILGAMTTQPHPFAAEVYSKYIDRNLGDRGLNPATVKLEREVISIIGNLLNNSHILGNLTSGGTEANIISMFLAKMNSKHIKNPNIVVPESAHYSFHKAALLLGLDIRNVPLLPTHQVDIEKVIDYIDEDTIAIVGVAGTSALGVVDPIRDLSKIALNHQLHFHVDGAFGGLILPYLEDLGYYNGPIYDFRVNGIYTYTVDPHKMGLGVNPSGGLIVNRRYYQKFNFDIPYLAGGPSPSFNLLGTRPGASAISFWALLKYLGKDGFLKIINECWQVTTYAYDCFLDSPYIEPVIEPSMNVLGIRPSKQLNISLDKFDKKIRQKGWALGRFDKECLMRLVFMPHVKKQHIDQFLNSLKSIF